MKNIERTVRDLVEDEYFHKLIINPDQECVEFWKRWENENSERSGHISLARDILSSIQLKGVSISEDKKELLWKSISNQIDKKILLRKQKTSTRFRTLYYGVAASLILAITTILAYNFILDKSNKQLPQEVKLIEIIAPKAKITTYKLEDGTIVNLFSGSKFVFPENFSLLNREVYLEGEAFFEVSKDINRPFIVKTNSLITTALGTSFNVRTDKNTDSCDISLVTGKVKVENVNKSLQTLNEIILVPGEEARYTEHGIVKQLFDIRERTGWKDGCIYLNNKTYEESISILARRFEVQIITQNQPKFMSKRAMGEFNNQTLENILAVMGHTFGFSARIDNDKIYIVFNGKPT